MRIALTSFALLLSTMTYAGELAGVTLPDTATVGGQELVLNGMGLREKYFLDIYVGGLYTPTKSTDANTLINADVPKKVVMKFIYRKVTSAQMSETFVEGLQKNPATAGLTEEIAELQSYMRDVLSGDEVVVSYVPGKGTSFSFNGNVAGTIQGVEFMKAIWKVYIGPTPPSQAFKKGLLGG